MSSRKVIFVKRGSSSGLSREPRLGLERGPRWTERPSQRPSGALCPLSASSGMERSPCVPPARGPVPTCPPPPASVALGGQGAAGGTVRPVLTSRGHRCGHESQARQPRVRTPPQTPDQVPVTPGPRGHHGQAQPLLLPTQWVCSGESQGSRLSCSQRRREGPRGSSRVRAGACLDHRSFVFL